jgi:predicted dehydrogenase
MIRIGIIGYGYWGPNLVRNFFAHGGYVLQAVADKREEARASLRRQYPAIRVTADPAEIISSDDIDAVAIATPVATHFPLAREALLRGKHVFVEKPLCTSQAEAQELIELAKRARRVLMVDHTFLFTGAVQSIRRIVQAGQLGRICYFDSMRVNLGLFQPDVNCLWDLAPHDLSIIDHLVDDEVVDIDVSGYCHVNPRLPDMVYLTLHYAGNMVAHFNLSWMSPVKVRRFAIGGTEQMLIWDDLDQDQKLRIYNSGIEIHGQEQRATIIPDYRIGDIYSPRVPRNEALGGVVDHFAKVVAGEERSMMDGERGLRVVKILEESQRLLDRNLREVANLRVTANVKHGTLEKAIA